MKLGAWACSVLLAAAGPGPGYAQGWPDKPIKLVISFAPGGE